MDVDRRRILLGSLSGAAALATLASAATSTSVLGRDVTRYGVRPGAPDDQSARLQRAINETARTRTPLWLPPGVYKAISSCRTAPSFLECSSRPVSS